MEPAAPMWLWTTSPEQAPDEAQLVSIDFVEGDPVAVDGNAMTPAALLAHLNQACGTARGGSSRHR